MNAQFQMRQSLSAARFLLAIAIVFYASVSAAAAPPFLNEPARVWKGSLVKILSDSPLTLKDPAQYAPIRAKLLRLRKQAPDLFGDDHLGKFGQCLKLLDMVDDGWTAMTKTVVKPDPFVTAYAGQAWFAAGEANLACGDAIRAGEGPSPKLSQQ